MAAAPVSIDNGPPLPQNLQPQGASAQQMAGGQQPGAPSGSASLVGQVSELAMGVEKALMQIGSMLPSFAGQVEGMIDTFRKQLGAALASGAQPPAASGPMGGSMTLMSGGSPTS